MRKIEIDPHYPEGGRWTVSCNGYAFPDDESAEAAATRVLGLLGLDRIAKDITQEEANELQSILRTLTPSGTELRTSARELVARMERAEAALLDHNLAILRILDPKIPEGRYATDVVSDAVRNLATMLESKQNVINEAHAALAEAGVLPGGPLTRRISELARQKAPASAAPAAPVDIVARGPHADTMHAFAESVGMPRIENADGSHSFELPLALAWALGALAEAHR